MKLNYVLYFLLVVVLFTSCVSQKQLTYLQEDESSEDVLIPIQKVQEPYRLQISDLLSIRVKSLDQRTLGIFNPIGEENINATEEQNLYYDGFTVDRHGDITIPNLGKIPVLGKTTEEVKEVIEKLILSKILKEESNLFVTVKLAGIRYTVNGEIGSPGSNIIYRDQVTIMEAIGNSGEIPVEGDKTDVIIIRQYPLGQKVHHIDLTTIDALKSPYFYIQPNDQIIINPLPQKSLGTGTTGLQTFTTLTAIVTAAATTILLFTRL